VDVNYFIVAAVCLAVGLVVGSLLTKTLSPQQKKRKALEERLKQKEDELKTYQHDVADHFVKTSEIVRELTRSQRDICEHLATGALRLTAPEVSRKVQDVAFEGLGSENKFRILSTEPAEPPKDYAPGGGILNESYGLTDIPTLKKKVDDDPIEVKSISTKKSSIDSDDDDPTLNIS
jgi:uncharacterized protein